MEDLKENFDSESCSRSINETVNGSHQFIIEGYSSTKYIEAGHYISSDIFTVGGFDWAIYFYPNGEVPGEIYDYIAVFIALAGEGTNVRASFEFTLLGQTGTGKHRVKVGPHTLKYKGYMSGREHFIRRAQLENSDFIKDDSLIIHCNVKVLRSWLEGPNKYLIRARCSDIMGERLRDMLESEIGCDVVFKVGNERFKAHKVILAASSPVFRAQFFGLVGNPKLNKVVVKDIEPAVFQAMLFFIYTSKLPEEITTNMVQHLLAAADVYSLEGLKLLCESKLCEELEVETVASTIALAEQYQCSKLMAISLKFAADPANLGAVMQSEGYRHLEESCPWLLSKMLKTFALGDGNSDLSSSQKRRKV